NVQKPPPQPLLELSDVDGAPYADGQDVTLVAGAQGGFHVWMQYAVHGLPAGTFTLERTAHRVSDGAVVLVYRGDVDVGAPAADGWWTAPAAIPMFMCPSPIGISVIDVPIEFTLRLLDAHDAELARAAITLVPRCPAGQLDFCTRICTG
ncbi:MAG TPA: hypothetical protein VF997_17975, partial [Polyangia bacterium]